MLFDGRKLLQGFRDTLGLSLQLSAKRFFQVAVTLEIFKCLTSSCVAPVETPCIMCEACLFKAPIRYVASSRGVNSLYSDTVSICRRSTARDVNLSNSVGCDAPAPVPVLPQYPRVARASVFTYQSGGPNFTLFQLCCNTRPVVSTRVLVASILSCVPWFLRSSSSRKSFVSAITS